MLSIGHHNLRALICAIHDFLFTRPNVKAKHITSSKATACEIICYKLLILLLLLSSILFSQLLSTLFLLLFYLLRYADWKREKLNKHNNKNSKRLSGRFDDGSMEFVSEIMTCDLENL